MKEEFPYQNDPAFTPEHNAKGCYFQVIAKIAWNEGAFRPINLREEIRRIADLCMAEGYMRKDFKVLAPNEVFLAFGLIVEYTDKWEKPDRVCGPEEREALRMYYDNETAETEDDKWHFVEGDGQSNCEWDPWEGGSVTAAKGIVVDKRIFRIMGTVREVAA